MNVALRTVPNIKKHHRRESQVLLSWSLNGPAFLWITLNRNLLIFAHIPSSESDFHMLSHK